MIAEIPTPNPQPPVPTVVIQPTRGLASLQLRALWHYRELLFFLVWRDVKVRYKQTALGIAWIVLQPVVSMVVFSLLFGGLLNVPANGVPYPIFAFAALVPWNYFAGSLTRVFTSLVNSANLISKVYFPRLNIPLSGVISGLVDFAVSKNAKVGQTMTLHIHGQHVVADLGPSLAAAPAHRFVTGPLEFSTPDRTGLTFWTPEGERTFPADQGKSVLASAKEGAPITVELDAEGAVVGFHRFN